MNDMASLVVLVMVLVIALTPAMLLLPLFAWARWLRRRAAVPRFVVGTSFALLAVGASVTLFGGAVASLQAETFRAVESGDGAPQERSRVLAEGISEAMNCGALGAVIASVLALWLLFGTWRWHWRR
jgi:hypothetical protein